MDQLLESVFSSNFDQFRSILESSFQNQLDTIWMTPTDGGDRLAHDIVKTCNIQMFDYMLPFLESKNVRNLINQTLLHSAVECNNTYALLKLLQCQADPNLQDQERHTPLDYAVDQSNFPLVRTLVEHGAQVTTPNDDQISTLSIAFRKNKKPITDYIFNIYRTNHPTYTDIDILKWSVWAENYDQSVYLEQLGYSPFARSQYGCTAFFYAVRRKQVPIVKRWVKMLLDPFMLGEHDTSLLHESVSHRSPELTELFLLHGVPLDMIDVFKETCVSNSFWHEDVDTLQILFIYGATTSMIKNFSPLLLDLPSHPDSCLHLAQTHNLVRRTHLLSLFQ